MKQSRDADYEAAASLRDEAEKLRTKKDELQKEWREQMNEITAIVDENIIAEVVSSMTGVSADST